MKPCLFSLMFLLATQCFGSVDINTATTLPNGTVGTAYSTVVKASGGCTPYQWAIASGVLPAGITAKMSSTTTSLNLVGTPTTAATYLFAVKVTGCGGHVSEVSYKVVIQAAARYVAITTTTLPNGTVGTAYSAVVKASGGCTPYKWAIASGALPAGVTTNVSSTTTALKLIGTPTAAATYLFAVKVTGCGGHVSEVSYNDVIQATANHVVDLSWKASTSGSLVGYNLYRSPDGVNWNKNNLSLIPATLYSDSTVSNGSTYYYSATAVDIYGRESSKTTPVKVVIP